MIPQAGYAKVFEAGSGTVGAGQQSESTRMQGKRYGQVGETDDAGPVGQKSQRPIEPSIRYLAASFEVGLRPAVLEALIKAKVVVGGALVGAPIGARVGSGSQLRQRVGVAPDFP